VSRRALPDYIERGGRQVWRPPYAAKHAEVFGFLLPNDRTAIDLLLQRDLVEPSYGAVDYRAAFDYIVVLLADIGRMACAEPPDSLLGFVREREVGVWCLVADAHRNGRLVWYLPYIFTDSGQTVATGREVYGYAKQIGGFEDDFPARLTTGGDTTVSALAVDPYAAHQRAEVLPMINVQALAAVPEMGQTNDLAGFLSLFTGAVAITEDVPSGPVPAPSVTLTPSDAPPPPLAPAPAPWVRRILDRVGAHAPFLEEAVLLEQMVANPTLVFLKQIRDIACSTKACFQAVAEAPFSVAPTSYRELPRDNFTVTVQDWASHPIASELGLPARTPIQPRRAFRAGLNFHSELGYDVWRAPT
jgi:hypothetical protein